MSVSRDDVLRTAALARINVPAEQVDTLAAELDSILGHMEVLRQVEMVEANEQDRPQTILREDVVNATPLLCARESFAPMMQDGFFLVPRLQTHGENRAESE